MSSFTVICPLSRLAVAVVSCSLLAGCGASQTAAESPSEAALSEQNTPTEGEPDAAETQTAVPQPCDDGSCIRCGDAVCLQGFFCDEEAQACSWLPACSSDLTCACVEKAMSGCSCEERNGGVFVRCG